MTDTIDTSEHARLIEQTLRLDLDAGEATQAIKPYDAWIPSLRSADATEVISIVEPVLFAQLRQPDLAEELFGYDPGGYPPMPPPLPPAPKLAWNDRFAEYPPVRRAVPRVRSERDPGRHRAAPRWTRWAIGVGSVLVLGSAFTLGVLAGVQW